MEQNEEGDDLMLGGLSRTPSSPRTAVVSRAIYDRYGPKMLARLNDGDTEFMVAERDGSLTEG